MTTFFFSDFCAKNNPRVCPFGISLTQEKGMLSVDVWVRISQLVSARQMTRLVLIGCKVLNTQLWHAPLDLCIDEAKYDEARVCASWKLFPCARRFKVARTVDAEKSRLNNQPLVVSSLRAAESSSVDDDCRGLRQRPHLVELDLPITSSHLAGAHLFPLSVNFPGLQSLSLEMHNTFGNVVFRNLPASLTRLRIQFTGEGAIKRMIDDFVPHLPQASLTDLGVYGEEMRIVDANAIHWPPHLTYLGLEVEPMTDRACVTTLANCPNLQTLQIKLRYSISNRSHPIRYSELPASITELMCDSIVLDVPLRSTMRMLQAKHVGDYDADVLSDSSFHGMRDLGCSSSAFHVALQLPMYSHWKSIVRNSGVAPLLDVFAEEGNCGYALAANFPAALLLKELPLSSLQRKLTKAEFYQFVKTFLAVVVLVNDSCAWTRNSTPLQGSVLLNNFRLAEVRDAPTLAAILSLTSPYLTEACIVHVTQDVARCLAACTNLTVLEIKPSTWSDDELVQTLSLLPPTLTRLRLAVPIRLGDDDGAFFNATKHLSCLESVTLSVMIPPTAVASWPSVGHAISCFGQFDKLVYLHMSFASLGRIFIEKSPRVRIRFDELMSAIPDTVRTFSCLSNAILLELPEGVKLGDVVLPASIQRLFLSSRCVCPELGTLLTSASGSEFKVQVALT